MSNKMTVDRRNYIILTNSIFGLFSYYFGKNNTSYNIKLNWSKIWIWWGEFGVQLSVFDINLSSSVEGCYLIFFDVDSVLSISFNSINWSRVKRDDNIFIDHLAKLIPFRVEQVWENSVS